MNTEKKEYTHLKESGQRILTAARNVKYNLKKKKKPIQDGGQEGS